MIPFVFMASVLVFMASTLVFMASTLEYFLHRKRPVSEKQYITAMCVFPLPRRDASGAAPGALLFTLQSAWNRCFKAPVPN